MKFHLQIHKLNKSYLHVASILISGILVCLTVLYSSGALTHIKNQIFYAIPKFPQYQKFKKIKDYSSQEEIFSSQPQISYNPQAKYLFVEVGDMNCPNCARFHGYKSNNDMYPYKRLFEDYISTGKMNYMFLDLRFINTPDKHNSVYCVAEQDTKRFFSYKDALYKNFDDTNTDFTLEKAKKYLKDFLFDMKKFEECYTTQRYVERVKGLSEFSSNYLQVKSTPTFLIFEVQKLNLTKLNGSQVNENFYNLKGTIVGNQDYDIILKPEIDKLINQ